MTSGHNFCFHTPSSLLSLSRTKLDSSQVTEASEKGQCLEGPYCWVEHRLDLALVPETLFLSHPLGEDFGVQCGRGQPHPMTRQMSQ